MKQRYSYLFAILASLSLFFGSCSKGYLDTVPKGNFDENTLTKANGGTETILQGIHGMMYQYEFGQWFGNGIHSLNTRIDWISDLYINTIPAFYMGIYRWTDHISPYGDMNLKTWDSWSTIIQHCNKVITLSKKESYDTEAHYNTVMAEAYMIRAYAESYLVQCFGKRYVPGGDNSGLGIVVRTEPTLEQKARSTVEETYAQIDKDVENALALFEKVKEAKSLLKAKNRINYSTAYGIAARIYLGKQDYVQAEKYATIAINYAEKSGFAKLQSGKELLDGFNNSDAKEWIWAYKHSTDQNPYFSGWGCHYAYNFQVGGKQPQFAINRSYYDRMGEKDVRRNWFIARKMNADGSLEPLKDLVDRLPEDVNYAAAFQLKRNGLPDFEYTGNQIKFRTLYGKGSSVMDAVFMRLGELYFIKAEAEARNGKEADAIKTLTSVMVTRDEGYQAKAGLAGQELIDEILINKWIDLYYEGGVFFDQKRIGHFPERMKAANIKYLEPAESQKYAIRNAGDNALKIATSADDIAWQFAIPYDEIKGNQLCKQNDLK